jgi:hypothetical protein
MIIVDLLQYNVETSTRHVHFPDYQCIGMRNINVVMYGENWLGSVVTISHARVNSRMHSVRFSTE